LVQFHSEKALGIGRSAKYWTTIEQANSLKTLDEVAKKLALPSNWGERNVVSIARIPKGTEVTYCFGRAESQISKTEGIFKGEGIQYLFKDFDPAWIVETRKISK
jgi:hypothetical protein